MSEVEWRWCHPCLVYVGMVWWWIFCDDGVGSLIKADGVVVGIKVKVELCFASY